MVRISKEIEGRWNMEKDPRTIDLTSVSIGACIVSVLNRLLKRNDISINDNFLEAGGQSLHAMTVIDELRDRFGIEISPVLIFECATIAEIADRCLTEEEEFSV
ncbi:MAG: acyl carrier protein [Parvularculaceae bacterium]